MKKIISSVETYPLNFRFWVMESNKPTEMVIVYITISKWMEKEKDEEDKTEQTRISYRICRIYNNDIGNYFTDTDMRGEVYETREKLIASLF
jgi:hypothetical protein